MMGSTEDQWIIVDNEIQYIMDSIRLYGSTVDKVHVRMLDSGHVQIVTNRQRHLKLTRTTIVTHLVETLDVDPTGHVRFEPDTQWTEEVPA